MANARPETGGYHPQYPAVDTPGRDSLPYPIYDRRSDPYSAGSRNPFDLKDTGYVKRRVEYDPVTKQYYVVEKIGNRYFR
ncbi:MAG: hypothetical protein EOO11_16860, partial [Chitinophagaceae bacterium]